MKVIRFRNKVPACFESEEQFAAWKELARISNAPSVCVDCTKEFQQRMKAQWRCENPQVTFNTLDDAVYLTPQQELFS